MASPRRAYPDRIADRRRAQSPPAEATPGIAARLVEFAAELRSEGVRGGTAELLDAVAVLEQIPWTDPGDFREALAATLAKSQEDRRLYELVFERFFFRAALAHALDDRRGLGGAKEEALEDELVEAVSYTHLTLPTICSV